MRRGFLLIKILRIFVNRMDEIVIYSKGKTARFARKLEREGMGRKGNEWEIRMSCWAV